MKSLIKLAAIAAAAAVTLPTAASAQGSHTPTGAERRAVLDALRGPVERVLGPDIEFVVQRIRVQGSYAFVDAFPQRRGGGRINPGRYLSDYVPDAGFAAQAILRNTGGGWRVARYELNAGDAWFCDEAPRGLVASCDGTD